MSGSHILVTSMDSVGTGQLTELLVHVVGSRTRIVSKPNSEVLDFERLLLTDLEVESVERERERDENGS